MNWLTESDTSDFEHNDTQWSARIHDCYNLSLQSSFELWAHEIKYNTSKWEQTIIHFLFCFEFNETIKIHKLSIHVSIFSAFTKSISQLYAFEQMNCGVSPHCVLDFVSEFCSTINRNFHDKTNELQERNVLLSLRLSPFVIVIDVTQDKYVNNYGWVSGNGLNKQLYLWSKNRHTHTHKTYMDFQF